MSTFPPGQMVLTGGCHVNAGWSGGVETVAGWTSKDDKHGGLSMIGAYSGDTMGNTMGKYWGGDGDGNTNASNHSGANYTDLGNLTYGSNYDNSSNTNYYNTNYYNLGGIQHIPPTPLPDALLSLAPLTPHVPEAPVPPTPVPPVPHAPPVPHIPLPLPLTPLPLTPSSTLSPHFLGIPLVTFHLPQSDLPTPQTDAEALGTKCG
jgi:hypothetical protein